MVDDDGIAARGTALVLKGTVDVIDHADTGEEALERVRLGDYDIVILDLLLPHIMGFEVVR